MQGCDAVICATGGGATSPFDKRAKKVDNEGTKHLVDAAAQAGVPSFVMVSSLLTNAKAVGEGSNPNYVILQVFGGVLEEKLQARVLSCGRHVCCDAMSQWQVWERAGCATMHVLRGQLCRAC